VVSVLVDVTEKKLNNKYYYQIQILKEGEKILEQFSREIADNYGGSRFPRRKEIQFSIGAKLKELNKPENGLSGFELIIRDEDEGSKN
jgi:hypothetical protein